MPSVLVPATSANLGPGFDSIGLALDWYERFTVTPADELEFELSGEGAERVPRDESHLVVRTLRAALRDLGDPHPERGLRLSVHMTIPHSRGLGSSAAAIGAGLGLAWALARPGQQPDLDWLGERASRIEGHPDNALAVIRGGAVLGWMDPGRVGHVALQVDPRISARVWTPEQVLPTARARQVLPEGLPRAQVIDQAARVGLLVHALADAPEQLMEATRDWLHTEQRAPLMAESDALRRRLRAAGVPAVVSGAGTTIIAIGTADQLAGADTVPHSGFTSSAHGLGHGLEISETADQGPVAQ